MSPGESLRLPFVVEANLLLVHHGMFWGGAQRIVGAAYERLRLLFAHNVAVYSSHLPLDAHPTFGNNVLLARALGLEPSGGFARYRTIDIGVRGECDQKTIDLVEQLDAFAQITRWQRAVYRRYARATYTTMGDLHRRWRIVRDTARGAVIGPRHAHRR